MIEDPNVEAVIHLHRHRMHEGLAKYGTTTASNPLSLYEWLQHAKEEAMDFAIYCEAAQRKMREEGYDPNNRTFRGSSGRQDGPAGEAGGAG